MKEKHFQLLELKLALRTYRGKHEDFEYIWHASGGREDVSVSEGA